MNIPAFACIAVFDSELAKKDWYEDSCFMAEIEYDGHSVWTSDTRYYTERQAAEAAERHFVKVLTALFNSFGET